MTEQNWNLALLSSDIVSLSFQESTFTKDFERAFDLNDDHVLKTPWNGIFETVLFLKNPGCGHC